MMKNLFLIFLTIFSINFTFAEEINVVDEYNNNRLIFEKKKKIILENKRLQLQQERLKQQQLFNDYMKGSANRAKWGIPDFFQENKPGGMNMTREQMMLMGGQQLPKIPPTGNINSTQSR